MEHDFLNPAFPDWQFDDVCGPLPVIDATPLHPDEVSPEEPAVAGENETTGCQSPGTEPEQPGGRMAGVTLARLAETLNLPLTFLEEQRLTDCKKDGLPAVRIPYLDPQGNTLAVKRLVHLQGEQRSFELRKADKPALYGLWELEEIREAEEVFLVNGIFDYWAYRHHEIAALGLPERNLWRDDWNEYLSGLTVLIWEKDAAFLVPKLTSTVQDLQIITMPDDFKSLTAAHLQGLDLFDLLGQCANQAVSAHEFRQNQANKQLGRLRKEAASVFSAADPVQVIREGIRSMGYGGDLNPPLITYLALTSRVLAMRPGAMPVHLLLLGQPSAGKSYCLKVVLKLTPSDTYNEIDAGSPKVFIYDIFDYQHRAVIFSEADSLPAGEDNPAASAIRNMLQDHYLHYKVTESDPETGKFAVREIEKLGPSVLITTAVKRLGNQLDSRLFSLEVPDDLTQIQAALEKQADIELAGLPDPDPALVAYQSYLQALAPWEVVIPFVRQLARRIGQLPKASRINRDFSRLNSFIKAVAVLRHRNRQRDEQGRIIAEIEDYALVHELVGKMYETSINNVSDKIRNVIRAVGELRSAHVSPVSETKVAKHLGCAKQAITQAVKTALTQGWIVNHETKQGHPYDLEVGEPLPEALGLPDPESLEEDPGEQNEQR
jgi:hypothetical protein